MDRVALSFGNISIYWYSIFILLAIICAFFIVYFESKKNNIKKELLFDMAFYSIIIGIICARIYYVLFNLDYYLLYPFEIIQLYKGGLAIHGGLIGGCLTIIFFSKKYNIDTIKMLDIIVVGVILGQAIGRWGNFFNQEAYGSATTYINLKSMKIPEFIINGMYINNTYYTPTFLYESIWNIIGFIILLIIRRNKSLKIGIISGSYLMWYSLGRFFIERLRRDSLMFANIKVAQLVSIILFILGIILVVKGVKDNRNYHIERNEL